MGALADDDRVYTLDLGLEEPITRAALIAARDAGHTVERVAVDSEQTVEHVLMRCEEEEINLPRLWLKRRKGQDALLASVRVWRHGDASVGKSAQVHHVSQHTLRTTLRRMGYVPNDRRARVVVQAILEIGAARRRPLVRRLKRLIKEHEARREAPPTSAQVQRALGVSAKVAWRVCRDAQYVPHVPDASYVACIDVVADALELPAYERPTIPEIARTCGATKSQAMRAIVNLGARWSEDSASLERRALAALKASPLRPDYQIAREQSVSLDTLRKVRRIHGIPDMTGRRIEAIRAHLATHPDASPRELAAHAQCSVSAVEKWIRCGRIVRGRP